jgi:two-component system, OmpR family, alkaline phosphatase synthesis response regulator PhoP
MAETIMIVDDEQRIINLAQMYLEQEGYTITSAEDGLTAYEQIRKDEPSLVILDLMMPGMDGWELCRRVRAESDVPILMLTARSDDIDKIVGLELGADDYLTKPFNPRELVARVKAILRRTDRRSSDENVKTITVGNMVIDAERRTVHIDGNRVDLRLKEFDLLLLFARNPRRVYDRDKLLEIVWGYDFAGETRTVDVHIAHLRHKLKGMNATIDTVWGLGYKLEP